MRNTKSQESAAGDHVRCTWRARATAERQGPSTGPRRPVMRGGMRGGFYELFPCSPRGSSFRAGESFPLTQYRLIEGRSKETSFSGESRGRQQHLRGCDLTVWCGVHVCRWLDVTCMCGRDHAPSRKRQVAVWPRRESLRRPRSRTATPRCHGSRGRVST